MEQSLSSFKLSSLLEPGFRDLMTPGQGMRFLWLGKGGLLLTIDGKTILIDPELSEMACDFPVDAVLISDLSKLDEESVHLLADREFITSKEVGEILKNWGISELKITELSLGEVAYLENVNIIRAPFSSEKNPCDSWIIKGINESIFYNGSNCFGEQFRKIGDEFGPFDVTFLDNEIQSPEETLQTHIDLNGELLIPISWSSVDYSNQLAQKIAKDWEIPLFIPRLGQIEDLEGLNI